MRHRLLTAVVLLASTVSGAAADYKLTILHTNDFHSRFAPIDRWDRDCPAEENAAGACFGGAARLATAVARARAQAQAQTGNLLLLDAGDQFPAPSHPAPARPGLLAELMNRMGYDAMAFGSHEFDEGSAVALQFVTALDFPALIANADFPGAPQLAQAIAKSVVVERGGQQLGLIGLTPTGLPYWRDVDYITVSDPVAAVQREVDRLTANGIDKIILLSHSGYGADQRIAKATTGIDVIVGGHTHTYLTNTLSPSQGPYPTMENGVAIVHAFPFGTTLGDLRVTFDDDGQLIEAVGDQMLLDASVIEEDDVLSLISAGTAVSE